ncbi:MAG: hydroxymethylglutaryl-CoA reductase, degradative, partial [Candidatus Binatia bacterium]
MTSRLPGFHRLPLGERLQVLADAADLSKAERELLATTIPLELTTAELMIENAIGVFGLPFAVAVNFQVNGRDYLVPMVTEEPSIVAAASNAARLTRENGGIGADADPSLMIGQIQVIDVADPEAAAAKVREAAPRLVAEARRLQPR